MRGGCASWRGHKTCSWRRRTFLPIIPRIERVKDEFSHWPRPLPTRITALFSFPPLKEDDFRYQERYGGGAFNDLGPYAISAGTVFFREYPREIFCRINSRAGNGIETAFSIAALYSRGRSIGGTFRFLTTEYQEYHKPSWDLSLCVRFDRVFTITPDCANTLHIRRKGSIGRGGGASCRLLF